MWAIAGAAAALIVLFIGWGALLVHHLRNLDRLTRWAGGSLDSPVPEGTGSWRPAFSALYRRVRMRVAYQRDLARTIERFQSAAEAIPDGMVVLDTANRIKWANVRACAHLGLDDRHDVGSPLMNIVRQPEFVRFLESGDFTEAIVIESQREAGVTLAIQIVPFGVEEKLLISRDITRLEAVARMRRDFIANVSHELKTPLTVIAGFLETLQELDLDEKQRGRFVQLMQEQATSMQRLVEDLLTLSALESEQNPLVDEKFAIVPLMLQLSSDAKSLSQGQHAVALDIGDAATVIGQPRRTRERVRQPRFECDPLHARRRHDHAGVARGRQRHGRVCRFRQRHRHRAGASAAADRAFLSHRPQPVARHRRHRAWPGHRQARAAAAPGDAGNRQRTRHGQHVRRQAAGPAGAARAACAGRARAGYQ